MKERRSSPPAEPFFLKVGEGQRFCLYHAPAKGKNFRGSFIYVHPFAEEMNKSRRMAALQARAFASAGIGVLQIDLFGCGDSCGDFGDARWDLWKSDLAAAKNWLEKHAPVPVSIWGLRLGALLALDFATDSPSDLQSILLWQPVINGESFLTQFLRTRLASEMLGAMEDRTSGTSEMRNALASGKNLEVAGYDLSPDLAARIDGMKAATLAVHNIPVHWFELMPEPGRPLPPAAAKVASEWKQRGVDLRTHLVQGTSFWASQEVTECPALLEATINLFEEVLS